MLPDILNWIVTNRLNWEYRYEAHMDRYAKTPDLTLEDPVRAASYLEIRESGMVVDFPVHPERINMWRPMVSVEYELSKACQNCISFGNALMEKDDKLKKTKDELSEAKEKIKELTGQVNAEESDNLVIGHTTVEPRLNGFQGTGPLYLLETDFR